MDQQTILLLAVAAAAFILYQRGYFRPSGRQSPPPAPIAQAPASQVVTLRHEMAPAPGLSVAPEEPVHSTKVVVPFRILVVPEGPESRD